MAKQILHHPVQTEKAVRGTLDQRHTFFVTDDANKIQVMQAVKDLYGIMPRSVRIVHLPGKTSGQGKLKRKPFKKAIVILKKGDTLDPFKLKK